MSQDLPRPTGPVVGFDLDMTLIDTAPGFGEVLRVLGRELGVDFPVAQMTERLGPPLEHLLADHLPPDQVGPAGDRFRALYPGHAIATVPTLPGAREAIEAVRRHAGRVLVVTGKYAPNARLHLDHLGLEVDRLEGWVWGTGKAEVLREEGAGVYVGDHVHDVEGGRVHPLHRRARGVVVAYQVGQGAVVVVARVVKPAIPTLWSTCLRPRITTTCCSLLSRDVVIGYGFLKSPRRPKLLLAGSSKISWLYLRTIRCGLISSSKI